MFLTLVVFILILGVLVFVHELGHFLVAKWMKMRVDEFALGFPPRLFARKYGETTYAVNLIPFGGYVKIHGEAPGSDDAADRSFGQKSVWARILVIIAGVVMNTLFAFIVLTVAFSIGFTSYAQDLSKIPGATVTRSQIVAVDTLPNNPAAKAGVQSNDILVSLTDPQTGQVTALVTPNQMVDYTSAKQKAGVQDLKLTYNRDGNDVTVPVTLNATGPALGVDIAPYQIIRIPVLKAPAAALKEMGFIVRLTWDALSGFVHKLFYSGQLDPTVSGPVGIYQATGQATQQGVVPTIFLLVALSLNLALLNILPIPALDGGKLLFLIIEIIVGKRRMNEYRHIEGLVNFVGFVLVMSLVVILSIRDIVHLL